MEGQIRRLQAVVFFMTVSLLLPCPAYPYYFTQFLHYSSASYGQIVGASSFAHLIAAVTYGRISDFMGRKRVMLFQTVLSFLLYLLFGVLVILATDSTSQLRGPIAAVFIILGLSNTVNLLTCSAVCDICLKPDQTTNHLARLRPKFLAQVAGVIALAGVVGPPVGQLLQMMSTDTRPHVVLFLAAGASAIATGVAMTIIETNKIVTTTASLNWDARSDASFRRHAVSPLLTHPTGSSFEIAVGEPAHRHTGNLLILATDQPIGSSSLATSSGPPSEGGEMTAPAAISDKAGPNTESTSFPVSIAEPYEEDPPDWVSLFVAYASQAIKALSLSTVSVCYALVLDEMLPDGWLFGLTSTQVLALGLSMTCIVRVTIQMGYFHEILRFLHGPGYTFLIGCTLMALGQLFIYITLRYLPGPMGLLVTNQHSWSAVPFCIVHFLAVGGLLSAGMSLIEPALSTLIALGVANHKGYQGISQGLSSASNLVGSTIGPPLFGFILALKKTPVINPVVETPDPWDQSLFKFHQSHSIRPAMVFYSAAVLAALPLLWGRKILKMSRGWENR